MYKDFRDVLDHLEKHGKLARIKKEVDPRFEIAAGIRKISDTDGPALLYENIKGHPGWRVAGGLYGTRKLVALGLQVAERDLLKHFMECESKRVKPKMVATGPVKEVIIKGNDIDLTKLPIPTHSELDAGPYISGAVQFARHPDTGIQNLSIVRMRILDKNKTTVLALTKHLGHLIAVAEERGQGLGIAAVIGTEPAVAFASQARPALGVDEIEIAGAFRGAPLEMVKCETIDVDVPANAEIIVEGVTIPGERAVDGPFGERHGTYALDLKTPVMKITAITMRKDPIFQAMLTGRPMTENHYLKEQALAAAVHREIEHVVPEIKAINITPGGGTTLHAVIAIRKRYETDPRSIIYALIGGVTNLKYVVVVDPDIDVFNPVDVEWAICNRVVPERDIIIAPNPFADPNVVRPPVTGTVCGRWGIDATMPMTKNEMYRKVFVPGEDKVDFI